MASGVAAGVDARFGETGRCGPKPQPTCVAVQTRNDVHVEICNEQASDRRRMVGPADRTAVTRARSASRSSRGLFHASATNAFQWLIQGVAVRIMPTASWQHRIVCAAVAAAASCGALMLAVIFASRYVPSVGSGEVAATIEQQRPAHVPVEREFVDTRSDTVLYAPLTDQEAPAAQSPERKLESVDGASRSGAHFRLRIEQRAKEAKGRKALANREPM